MLSHCSLLRSLPSPAFVDSVTGISISYTDLFYRVKKLINALTTFTGISKSDVAFNLAPACLEIPVLYFALLSIGVIISPANPVSTPVEISRLISLVNPAIIFTTSSMVTKLSPELRTKIILLDTLGFISFMNMNSSTMGEEFLEIEKVQLSDSAAILFSSGTTGNIKGVVITHLNLIASIEPLRVAREGRQSPTVQFVTAPLFHVYGFLFSLKGIAVGETTVVLTARFAAEILVMAVERYQVTHFALAPPSLAALVDLFEDRHLGHRRKLSSLEAMTCGGAPLGVELIHRFAAMFPNVWLAQGYGLTESTGGVFRHISPGESRRIGSCGRVVATCEAKIVDPETGVSLPPCMEGELWLRGPVIMKGYIADPKATSEILDPEGWLRTGDLCYFDEDGFLFVVDRIKELIKYKGYQVPPAELEGLLQAHVDVIDAAIIPYPDSQAGQVPMALVVRKPYSTLSEAEVMNFVARQVAPYKKVRRVSFVSFIPTNAAGKILRKELVKIATSEEKSKSKL